MSSQPLNVDKINLTELNSKLSGENRKNKSLFAQNLELKGKLKSHYPLDHVQQGNKRLERDERVEEVEKSLSSVIRRPIITGEGLGNKRDVEQIHTENLNLLARMSHEEILAEQKKLLDQLDPKLVAFIRKRNQNLPPNQMETESIDQKSSEARPPIELV